MYLGDTSGLHPECFWGFPLLFIVSCHLIWEIEVTGNDPHNKKIETITERSEVTDPGFTGSQNWGSPSCFACDERNALHSLQVSCVKGYIPLHIHSVNGQHTLHVQYSRSVKRDELKEKGGEKHDSFSVSHEDGSPGGIDGGDGWLKR